MMSLIIQTATQQGYQTMNAEILKENTPMLKLAEKSGLPLPRRKPTADCIKQASI